MASSDNRIRIEHISHEDQLSELGVDEQTVKNRSMLSTTKAPHRIERINIFTTQRVIRAQGQRSGAQTSNYKRAERESPHSLRDKRPPSQRSAVHRAGRDALRLSRHSGAGHTSFSQTPVRDRQVVGLREGGHPPIVPLGSKSTAASLKGWLPACEGLDDALLALSLAVVDASSSTTAARAKPHILRGNVSSIARSKATIHCCASDELKANNLNSLLRVSKMKPRPSTLETGDTLKRSEKRMCSDVLIFTPRFGSACA